MEVQKSCILKLQDLTYSELTTGYIIIIRCYKIYCQYVICLKKGGASSMWIHACKSYL